MKPSPEGRRNRPVNLTRNSGDDYRPSWSPNGTRIAFASIRGALNDSEVGLFAPEIYTMKADGTDQLPLTENQESSDDPVWSPDGSKNVFTRSVDIATSDDYDIFVMSSKASIPVNITNHSAFDSAPDWQPLPQ